MSRTSDVVVVGGGIIGSSIAYQLAVRGVTVRLLDKGLGPAEGSTGASSSICRCRYTHPEVVRLAYHGREAYGNWHEFTGLPEVRSGLTRTGVLWIMGETKDKVDIDVSKLRSQGVEAETFGPDDLVGRFPAVSACAAPFDLTGEIEHVCEPGEAFLFEVTSGYVDPVGANQDFLDAARAAGAEVEFNQRVTEVISTGDTVTGVRTANGDELSADLIINAAGPWCNQLNAMAGVEHRWTLTPTRIQTVYRPWPAQLGSLPTAADGVTGIYFRPESGGQSLLVGSVIAEDEEEVVDDPDHFKRVPDADYSQMKMAMFHHRIPNLEARGDLSGIAGLYTINREDVHPILGPVGKDGFWVANGFSGHGFKLAPAIGSMVAQEYTGLRIEGDTDVEMSFFAADREPIDVEAMSVLA